MAIESHLQTIYKNGVDRIYKPTLRHDFFLNHLKEVLSDRPWTVNTFIDTVECLTFMSPKELLKSIKISIRKKRKSLINKLFKKPRNAFEVSQKNLQELYFEDANSYADFIEDKFVKKFLNANSITEIFQC